MNKLSIEEVKAEIERINNPASEIILVNYGSCLLEHPLDIQYRKIRILINKGNVDSKEFKSLIKKDLQKIKKIIEFISGKEAQNFAKELNQYRIEDINNHQVKKLLKVNEKI
jgi:uncharacterized protein YfkK (UPF0435 family)